jgi:hypothetical protein
MPGSGRLVLLVHPAEQLGLCNVSRTRLRGYLGVASLPICTLGARGHQLETSSKVAAAKMRSEPECRHPNAEAITAQPGPQNNNAAVIQLCTCPALNRGTQARQAKSMRCPS